MFSETTITLQDVGAYGPGMDILCDDRYVVKDWNTGKIFTSDSENNVYFDGAAWGTVKDLLKLEIVEIGFDDDGKFAIQVAAY